MSEESYVARKVRTALSKAEAAHDLLQEATSDLACTTDTRGVRAKLRAAQAGVRKIVAAIRERAS